MPKLCQTEYTNQRKQLLENSLLNLLDTKPYPDITVKDICQEADIPRRTFYHYFESKGDVLESLVSTMIMDCFLQVMFDIRLGIENMRSSFEQVFRFWQGDNRRRLDCLIRNGLESQLMASALQWLQHEKVGILQNSDLNPKLVEIGLMVGVTDFFSLLFYWSRNGYQETPEQMANYAMWVLPQAFYTL